MKLCKCGKRKFNPDKYDKCYMCRPNKNRKPKSQIQRHIQYLKDLERIKNL